MDQGKRFPFTDYCQNEIVKGDLPLMAPVCETRQIKLEYVLQWLVLQSINDYLQHIYEQ
jgi:hypothetical protein